MKSDEDVGLMRPCGCHRGRPCTCEMSKAKTSCDNAAGFACNSCTSCKLNSRAAPRLRRRQSMAAHRCLNLKSFMEDMEYDVVHLPEDIVFRMRKPTWRTDDHTTVYNKLRQMRLALEDRLRQSRRNVDDWKKQMKKLHRDIYKAQEVVKRMEDEKAPLADVRKDANAWNLRRPDIDLAHVDSDAFDLYSKQLIPAATLLPELQRRLNVIKDKLAKEEIEVKMIKAFIHNYAANTLQDMGRQYLRRCEWMQIWLEFREQVTYAAAVVIQSVWRMRQSVVLRQQLLLAIEMEKRNRAVVTIQRFVRQSRLYREAMRKRMEANQRAQRMNTILKGMNKLAAVFRIANLRFAFHRMIQVDNLLKQQQHDRKMKAAVRIQAIFRGYTVRRSLSRYKKHSLLLPRVDQLVRKYLSCGDLWAFILQVDADYRRYEDNLRQEVQEAKTFVSTVLTKRYKEDEKMMQSWFEASTIDNPIVKQAGLLQQNYRSDQRLNGQSRRLPPSKDLSKAKFPSSLLHSSIAQDLMQLSPTKSKSDVFPTDLPAKAMRFAVTEGYELSDVVTLLRKLREEGLDMHKTSDIMKIVRSRLSKRLLSPVRAITKQRCPVTKKLPDTNTNMNDSVLSSISLQRVGDCSDSTDKGTSLSIQHHLLPAGLNAPAHHFVHIAISARNEEGVTMKVESCESDSKSEQNQKLEQTRAKRKERDTYCKILSDHECFTGYDILSKAKTPQDLVIWGFPTQLALELHAIVVGVKAETKRSSKQEIRKQVRLSPEFDSFYAAKSSETKEIGVNNSMDNFRDTESYHRVKKQLESKVLGLPLDSTDLPLENVLFKAAFLSKMSKTSRSDGEAISESFSEFVRTVVLLQQAGDTDELREHIQDRTEQAQDLAFEVTRFLHSRNVNSVTDVMQVKGLAMGGHFSTIMHTLRYVLKPLKKKQLHSLPPNSQSDFVLVDNDSLTSPKRSHQRSPSRLQPLSKYAEHAAFVLSNSNSITRNES